MINTNYKINTYYCNTKIYSTTTFIINSEIQKVYLFKIRYLVY
jgi:hypothetical protein